MTQGAEWAKCRATLATAAKRRYGKDMNITLTPEWAQLVQSKVASGQYLSPMEVVQEALNLLEERDRVRQTKIELLRKDLQSAIDQVERGQYTTLTDDTWKEITAEGRRRAAERRQGG
jgi:antitoxin ParD1/3/4